MEYEHGYRSVTHNDNNWGVSNLCALYLFYIIILLLKYVLMCINIEFKINCLASLQISQYLYIYFIEWNLFLLSYLKAVHTTSIGNFFIKYKLVTVRINNQVIISWKLINSIILCIFYKIVSELFAIINKENNFKNNIQSNYNMVTADDIICWVVLKIIFLFENITFLYHF